MRWFLTRAESEQRIAEALLSEPVGTLWSSTGLRRVANVRVGHLYPILWQWFTRGWLADEWTADGRRLYRVSPLGAPNLRTIRQTT